MATLHIRMALVGKFLTGGKSGNTDGVNLLDDRVEVEGWIGLTIVVIIEVGQIERHITIISPDTGHIFVEFCPEPYYYEGTPNLLPCHLEDRQNMKKPPADVSIA